MTKLKLSSKMHIMIIVSAVIVAAGVAMGLIFQFVSNGYFNYGADYTSYNSVVVNYAYIDGKEDSINDICEKAFKEAGVSYYAYTYGDVATGGKLEAGGQLVYKFSKNTDTAKIQSAKDAIHSALTAEGTSGLSKASYHEAETVLGGGKALTFGAIALASAVVFQFIYFAIRYKLTAAFSALLADVHNLAIFVSLLAITRVPTGSTVFAFAALTVVATMIGCCFLFDKARKNSKDEKFAKLDALEQADVCANESITEIAVTAVGAAVIGLILFVLMSVSALSVQLAVTSAVLALLSAAASIYGTAFFTPSVYSRIRRAGGNLKASHPQKVKKS